MQNVYDYVKPHAKKCLKSIILRFKRSGRERGGGREKLGRRHLCNMRCSIHAHFLPPSLSLSLCACNTQSACKHYFCISLKTLKRCISYFIRVDFISFPTLRLKRVTIVTIVLNFLAIDSRSVSSRPLLLSRNIKNTKHFC